MPEEVINDSNVPNHNAQTPASGDDWEEWLTANVGPGGENASWPLTLPEATRWYDSGGLDDMDIVVPSWNAIPRREVVRAGRTVAVIDTTECGVIRVVECVELSTEDEARLAYHSIFARECHQARVNFQELPDDLKVGALVSRERDCCVPRD